MRQHVLARKKGECMFDVCMCCHELDKETLYSYCESVTLGLCKVLGQEKGPACYLNVL